ncbi:cyclic GMP-AMP synthase DncV-like nucleotidyltransferase [Vibrio owensii]|uniref:cyclic GMP-AMP synthase DncV-like nucleotidyltransferase n=1 Tax=Vibrio owensii TaxID=696485 RepID=UPI00390A1EF9
MQNYDFKSLRKLNSSDKEFCFEMISKITSNLDLTETQLSQLTTAYRAIGSYLANQGGKFADCHVYAQGSVGIGTSVKPIDEDSDMDIDLVLHLPNEDYPLTTDEANQLLFSLIDVLKRSQRYGNKVENLPKRRCVTLQYGDIEGQGFHMDITPSMPENIKAPSYKNNVRVADIKDANSPSHPHGYRSWFRSACSQDIRWSRKSSYKAQNQTYAGTVEELPGQSRKTVLQIVVQLLKRHRDMWKKDVNNVYAQYAPISIIITTLAGLAYEQCSRSKKEYENPFDLMLDVLEAMPRYISQQHLSDGTLTYTILNPALPTENFADKWHEKPMLAQAFKDWYHQATRDLSALLEFGYGIDHTITRTKSIFGNQAAKGLETKLADTLTNRRAMKRATVSSVGLGLSNSATAKPVPKHDFYGNNR